MSSLKKFVIFTPDTCESLLLVVRPVGWAVVQEYPIVYVYGQDIEFRKIGLSRTNLKECWNRVLSHGGLIFESVQKNAYHGRYALLPTIAGGPGHRYSWYGRDVHEQDGCWLVPWRDGKETKVERIPCAEETALLNFYIDRLFMHDYPNETKVAVYGPPFKD